MHKRPPSCWWLPASLPWVLAIVLGFLLAAARVDALVYADDEGEEEDPTAKLVGLLDPSRAKPLMTLAAEKDFRAKKERAYTAALKSIAPNNAEEQLINEGVRFRVQRITIPENWANIANRTKELVNDLEVFAGDVPRAREVALKASVRELDALLFSDQPAFVKINAVWLLARLNIENVNRRTRTPAVPYAPAADPLVRALNDSQLGLDVKVAAVRGLARILEDGDPSRDQRDKISKALTDQLSGIDGYVSGEGRDWYQWRLVDALGNVGFPRTMTQQTFVVDALWKTMHDESLPWRTRTRAARSLGQLKLDTTFNIPLLAHEIVLMAGQMAFQYNQNPNLSYWPLCFSDLYFAFKAKDERQQQRGWGLMQNPPAGSKQVVDGAYQQVLTLVNAVLKNDPPQAVPNNLFGPISTWLKANTPADRKIHPNAQPLKVKAVEDSSAAQSGAANLQAGP